MPLPLPPPPMSKRQATLALRRACEMLDLRGAREAIAQGANVNRPDAQGRTPLGLFVLAWMDEVGRRPAPRQFLRALQAAGANLDVAVRTREGTLPPGRFLWRDGDLPLADAFTSLGRPGVVECASGSPQCVTLAALHASAALLERFAACGANLGRRDNKDRLTLMHVAACCKAGTHDSLVRTFSVLLGHGLRETSRSRCGQSAMDIAAVNPDPGVLSALQTAMALRDQARLGAKAPHSTSSRMTRRL